MTGRCSAQRDTTRPKGRRLPVPLLNQIVQLSVVLGMPLCQAQPGPSALTGSVVDESSKPVAGALVALAPLSSLSTQPTAGRPVSARTDASGTFSVPAIGPNTYGICVIVLDRALLNPCEWANPAPTLVVTPGVAPAPLKLTLKQGAALRVRINDPGKLVPTPETPHEGNALSIFVTVPDASHHMAHHLSSDNQGHDFEVIVPFDTDLKVSFAAMGMQIQDQQGNRIDNLAGQASQPGTVVAAGTVPTGFVYVAKP